jgi:hypothetical protein
MFKPPFLVGTPDNIDIIRSGLFEKQDGEIKHLFFKLANGKYRKIGSIGRRTIDFLTENEISNNAATLFQPYRDTLKNLNIETTLPGSPAMSDTWNGKQVWVSDGTYWYLFSVVPFDASKFPLFMNGEIISSFDPQATPPSYITFQRPINAKLFYYGVENISQDAPASFKNVNIQNAPTITGAIVVPMGDVFFGKDATVTKEPPKATKSSEKKKSSGPSSSEVETPSVGTDDFAAFLPVGDSGDGEGTKGAPVAEVAAEEVPQVFISLLPTKVPASPSPQKSLVEGNWVKVREVPISAKDFAGNLVLHTLSPDTYPFGKEVRICFNCATELVLRHAPKLKKYKEFYSPVTGVERWNGRFIYKESASKNAVDLKNTDLKVDTPDSKIWGTPPSDVGLYIRESIDYPLELQIRINIDGAGQWIFGVLTR